MVSSASVEDATLTKNIAVVGAGMGGLAAALRLNQRGHDVTVFEARSGAGGLASSFELAGLRFDYGPYILLDKPGLSWVFDELEVPLELVPLDAVYEVLFDDGRSIAFYKNRERTAAAMELSWPGSRQPYLKLVQQLERVYIDTQPLQFVSKPSLLGMIRAGALRHVGFFLRGLESVLASSGLPREIRDAIMIWTHIAGQSTSAAPSPLALVPALIHGVGAYYPKQGMGSLAASLEAAARQRGVRFRYDTRVRRLHADNGRMRVDLSDEQSEFDAVLSNAHGVGTYLTLMSRITPRVASQLKRLPLQPPGHCEYLRVKGEPPRSYLRFRLRTNNECRLFVDPRALETNPRSDIWYPARLVGAHARGSGDDWWEDSLAEAEVLAHRTPEDWGRDFHLFRNTMNPVMTARFMRQGRLAHRSPFVPGLYLAGSSTHPGQWVSFTAISGILAADQLHEDRV